MLDIGPGWRVQRGQNCEIRENTSAFQAYFQLSRQNPSGSEPAFPARFLPFPPFREVRCLSRQRHMA